MHKGDLYLIPNIIAPDTQTTVLNSQILECISKVDHYLVEDLRNARRFISSLGLKPVANLSLEVLDKHTTDDQLSSLLDPLSKGNDMGIISEAGCPAIADPGHLAVTWAHNNDIKVIPLVGPSSIILALMGSGLNGQSFQFHGYLPIQAGDRNQKIRQLELESGSAGQTQIFMETPYRNQALFEALLATCNGATKLCLACNLTATDQLILTRSIGEWSKQSTPEIHKKPCIFLMQG